MRKGFVSILEAFLAISLIYIMLSQVQISIPPRYADTANIEKLNTYAHDIAFSICGNYKMRRALINDQINFDLANAIPADVGYHIYIYKNLSIGHILDQLVYDYGSPPSSPAMTSVCIIAGGPNASTYVVANCSYQGTNCSTQIGSSDNNRVNLNANENFTVTFSATSGSIIEFVLEGVHNQSGGTTSLYNYQGTQIAAYNFSAYSDEAHLFDLSAFFTSWRNIYNITIKSNVSAGFDYAYLNVSRNIYAPRRILVQTWNLGG